MNDFQVYCQVDRNQPKQKLGTTNTVNTILSMEFLYPLKQQSVMIPLDK